MWNENLSEEKNRRETMWSELLRLGGPKNVQPSLLRELGIYGGQQGIWVDLPRTSGITASDVGVTIGVLHTGASYEDDLFPDGIIYHYPKTARPLKRDQGEIEATKEAKRLNLPIFIVTYESAKLRNVDLGWVEDWDDESARFLISFGDEPLRLDVVKEEPAFYLSSSEEVEKSLSDSRSNQQRFKFYVFKRYGPSCMACGLSVIEILEAAHIYPKKLQGTDDERNGLVLCPTHHVAYDKELWAIHPETLNFHFLPGGPSAGLLEISKKGLSHLSNKPHKEALLWRWNEWQARST